MKQTAESSDRPRALQLGDSRTLVDAGTYDDAVHGHDVSQPVEFTLGWSLEQKLSIRDPLTSNEYAGDALEFSARLEADAKHQPRTVSFRYQNAAFASDFVLEFERVLKSVFYVGPLREYPKRLYLWSGEVRRTEPSTGRRSKRPSRFPSLSPSGSRRWASSMPSR